MRFTIIYLSFAIFSLYCNQFKDSTFSKQTHLAEQEKQTIISLFSLLKNSSLSMQIQVAERVAKSLEVTLKKIQSEISEADLNKKTIAYETFFKRFLIEHQIDYLRTFINFSKENALKKDSLIAYTKNAVKNINTTVKNFLGFNSEDHEEKKLYELILEFIQIERDEILSHYDQLVLYFSPRAGIQLPTIINFWQTNEIREKIKKRARYIAKPQIQWVGLVASMAIQAIILAGGSMAIEWEDDADRQVFEEAQSEQSKITADWQAFQTGLANNQKKIMGSVTNLFAQESKKLQDEYLKNSQQLNQEILYLNKSINLNTPIIQALVSPIQYDQYFENSIMLTPLSKSPWYNIYQVSQSDWEFDEEHNCFRQNGLAPFPSPLLWEKKGAADASIFVNDPQANSIFTEYATGQETYEIEIECKIIKCSYPFFLGVMFNRGRWISGDPERIWQYRLLGFLGKELIAGNNDSRTVDFCFAQQKLNQANGKAQQIVSPLEQIMSNQLTHLYQCTKNEIQMFNTDLPTYIFNITTSPSTVFIKLSKINEKKEKEELYSRSILNLDDYLFKFGGIGFIASGCQATFKINKPASLVSTQSQIIDFSNIIASLIK